jgi:hypothetical protein
LITVPIGAALLLTIALVLNRCSVRPLPDGWLVVILATGFATHAALIGGYFLALDSAYRERFIDAFIAIPQPFVAGMIAGAIYWISLHSRSDKLRCRNRAGQ